MRKTDWARAPPVTSSPAQQNFFIHKRKAFLIGVRNAANKPYGVGSPRTVTGQDGCPCHKQENKNNKIRRSRWH